MIVSDTYNLFASTETRKRKLNSLSTAYIFSLLSSVFCDVVQASLRIAVNPTKYFSYSLGSCSSMYFLMFCLTCSLRLDKSLLIPGYWLICNILDISN